MMSASRLCQQAQVEQDRLPDMLMGALYDFQLACTVRDPQYLSYPFMLHTSQAAQMPIPTSCCSVSQKKTGITMS